MRSLLQNIPLFVILIVVFQIVRAIKKAQQANKDYQASGAETDEQRRVREIQERIRRIAAERRGGAVPPARSETVEPPVVAPPRRAIFIPDPIAPLDPFGGPQKRD